jgi:hypothetical protein
MKRYACDQIRFNGLQYENFRLRIRRIKVTQILLLATRALVNFRKHAIESFSGHKVFLLLLSYSVVSCISLAEAASLRP